jgi:hypothetical protein
MRMFRGIFSSFVAICVFAQADQWLFGGRYTEAALAVLEQIAKSLVS